MDAIMILQGGVTWIYRASAPDTNAGGGTLKLEVKLAGLGYEGKEIEVSVGPDNYATNRQIEVEIWDEDDNRVRRIAIVSMDNALLSLPTLGDAVGGNNDAGTFPKFMNGLDKLIIRAGSVAQNETLTIAIRIRLRSQTKPTVTWSSSGTLGTVTTDYNKFS